MRPEASLQAAWLSDSAGLTFTDTLGRRITVLHPGRLNTGNGPDFSDVCLRIDTMVVYGSAELHRRCSDWYAHGHHTDPAYEHTLLHIATEAGGLEDVVAASGRRIASVWFNAPAASSGRRAPCKPFWQELPGGVFAAAAAVEKEAYLHRCLARLEPWMPPGAGPVFTLISCVTGGSARILGGALNRAALEHHAARLLGLEPAGPAAEIHAKGVRPAARLPVRLAQLHGLHKALSTMQGSLLLRQGPEAAFDVLTATWEPAPGAPVRATVYQLVWLPALMLAARMVRDEGLHHSALAAWNRSEHPVPGPVKRWFAGAPVAGHRNTGLIHLARYRCAEGRCTGCAVFEACRNST